MLRDYWRDPHFWAWWWRHRVSAGAKIVSAVVAISLLGFGGYAAAGGLNSTVTASSSEPLLAQVTTVERLVTLRETGRVVTRPIRIVRTIPGRGSTSYETQVRLNTVTTPGNTAVVIRRDVRTVPVVQQVVVTRDGRVRTVVQNRPGVTQVRTSLVTDRRTVTNERVLTNERVVTSERVVTEPVTTTRVVTSERVITQPVTTTRIVTETFPVTLRSTDTIFRTETETKTETVPVTVVETLPVTVTVTVRKP